MRTSLLGRYVHVLEVLTGPIGEHEVRVLQRHPKIEAGLGDVACAIDLEDMHVESEGLDRLPPLEWALLVPKEL